QRLHHALTHVVADDLEARLRKLQRERQAYVAETDDTDTCCPLLDLGDQLILYLHLLLTRSGWILNGHRSRELPRSLHPSETARARDRPAARSLPWSPARSRGTLH